MIRIKDVRSKTKTIKLLESMTKDFNEMRVKAKGEKAELVKPYQLLEIFGTTRSLDRLQKMGLEKYREKLIYVPSNAQEIRDYLLENKVTNIKKELYSLFPEKTSREINQMAIDFEDYLVTVVNGSSMKMLEEIKMDTVDTLYGDYPVYNIIKNDIIIIAGQSNVGKSYHCGLMFKLVGDEINKLYICPDQGERQCSIMLNMYKVKNCAIDDQQNLHFAMQTYFSRFGRYPELVCYDMISSLPSIGTSSYEQQIHRAQELRKIKSTYPDTTFMFVAEIRKNNGFNSSKDLELDDLMGASDLAYKSDLVVGIYKDKDKRSTLMKVLKARIGNTKGVVYDLGEDDLDIDHFAINAEPEELGNSTF